MGRGVLRRLERDALDAGLGRHDAVMLELLNGSQHAAVESCKNVHDFSRNSVARLTQFGSGVKQPPVLGERVAVGHAGDEIADIADIMLRRRLLPPFRRQRLKVVAIAREEVGDDAFRRPA